MYLSAKHSNFILVVIQPVDIKGRISVWWAKIIMFPLIQV